MVGNTRPTQHNGAVDVTASLEAAVQPDPLFEVVSDLGTYPRWLDIVPRADPDPAAPDDAGPAWSVDLRGQLGPLRRSKRLRMVRTRAVPGELVVFERHELDDRSHSDWILRARIAGVPGRAPACSRWSCTTAARCGCRCSTACSRTRSSAPRGRLLGVLGVTS